MRYRRIVRCAGNIRDRFARCPDLPAQEFLCYLAGFSRLREAEAASCEGLVTECEVCDVLKQVSLNKSLGLDGLHVRAVTSTISSSIYQIVLWNINNLHTSLSFQITNNNNPK